MPKYQCPECEAILKRDTPIAAGKKIKCPKCELIFAAKPMRETEDVKSREAEEEKTQPTTAATSGESEDDEEGGSYSLKEEAAATEADLKAKKESLYFGSLRDKFAKSKRGPAMARVVGFSNSMLFIGGLLIILNLFGFFVGLWPFLFSDNPPQGARAHQKIYIMVSAVINIIIGGFICYGGSKLHTLESWGFALAGGILTALTGLGTCVSGLILCIGIIRGRDSGDTFALMMGILLLLAILSYGGFAIYTAVKVFMELTNQDVKDGFIETQEKGHELKN
jgi:hypothetical protein